MKNVRKAPVATIDYKRDRDYRSYTQLSWDSLIPLLGNTVEETEQEKSKILEMIDKNYSELRKIFRSAAQGDGEQRDRSQESLENCNLYEFYLFVQECQLLTKNNQEEFEQIFRTVMKLQIDDKDLPDFTFEKAQAVAQVQMERVMRRLQKFRRPQENTLSAQNTARSGASSVRSAASSARTSKPYGREQQGLEATSGICTVGSIACVEQALCWHYCVSRSLFSMLFMILCHSSNFITIP